MCPVTDLFENDWHGNRATHVPTSMAEVAGAKYDAMLRTQPRTSDWQIYNESQPLVEQRNRKIDELLGEGTVKRTYDEVAAQYPPERATMRMRDDFLKEQHKNRINALIAKGRDEDLSKWQAVQTDEEIFNIARDKAQVAQITSQEVSRRAEDNFALYAGEFVGGAGAIFSDPVNIATLPLGAAAASGILRGATIDGLVNMALETVDAPQRAQWMNDLGFKYGLSDVVSDVAIAGGGGFALSALFRTGARSLQYLDKIASDPRLPREVRDAATYQKKVAHIDENMPPIIGNKVDDYREELRVHRENTQEAATAFNEYREPVLDQRMFVEARAKEIEPDAYAVMQSAPTRIAELRAQIDEIVTSSTAKIDAQIEAIQAQMAGQTNVQAKKLGTKLEKLQQERDAIVQQTITSDQVSKLRRSIQSEDIKARDAAEKMAVARQKAADESGDVSIKYEQKPEQVDAEIEALRQRMKDQPQKADVYQAQIDSILSQRAAAAIPSDPISAAKPLRAPQTPVPAEPMTELPLATIAEFNRLLDEFPDQKIVMADGSSMTISEIMDSFAEEEDILQALTICGVGK